MKVDFLEEPDLEFGGGGRHVDIRFGLMAHGVLDRGASRVPERLRVGIVGTHETIEGISAWLERSRGGIAAKASRQPNLFPRFPAEDEQVFGTRLELSAGLTATISRRDITRLLAGAHTPEGVEVAVEMFIAEARRLCEIESPNVLVCAPPAELLEAIEGDNSPEVPRDGGDAVGDADANPQEMKELPSFHDVLKARGLSLPRPLQMVRPETYDAVQRRQKGHPERVRNLQDSATRAWNLYTALFYKAGGIPWRLARESRDLKTCFVGVSFYRTPDRDRLMTSMAQVFNELGEGMIVRGGAAYRDKDDRQVHLGADGAQTLLASALASYRREHHHMPARVVLHKTSMFNTAELQGFQQAADAERVDALDLVVVGLSSTRLFRIGTYPPLRGTLLSLDSTTHLLYTRGSVDFFMTYPGLYVPRPLRFLCAQTEETARFLGQEILALTKQNWNNTQFDQRDPITVRAARQVGAILKHVSGDVLQSRYSYYM